VPPVVVVTIVCASGNPVGREMTVTFSPAALLETVPESVTASPKMLSVRDADSETRVRRHGDRPGEACRGRSVYANVPAVGKAHDPLCAGSRVSLHEPR